jgi:hypothetical protein
MPRLDSQTGEGEGGWGGGGGGGGRGGGVDGTLTKGLQTELLQRVQKTAYKGSGENKGACFG